MQFKIVIGFGGWEGKGWLYGMQVYLDFLLESLIDFIIVVFVEEFGLLGVCVLLMIYFVIVVCGIYIVINVQDIYLCLLVGFIMLIFFVYVFVNIGMVSGILLVVGVLLLMVSYGGIFVVILMVSFGILMLIQIYCKLLVI